MMTMNMTKTHTKTVSGEMSKRYAQMSESRMREGAEVVERALKVDRGNGESDVKDESLA
ncbi:MAG: hypothetical protein A4E69_00457 [Syntrophus sp. PtaB.Bin138]|jgi:hypothetical protein|nr:MAG: hypothetical protein A4E69_00457 [Syntrophus sp. PtaB.Bin138]